MLCRISNTLSFAQFQRNPQYHLSLLSTRKSSFFAKITGFSKYSNHEDILSYIGKEAEESIVKIQSCITHSKFPNGEWLVEFSNKDALESLVRQASSRKDEGVKVLKLFPKHYEAALNLTAESIGAGPNTLRLINVPGSYKVDQLRWYFRDFEVEDISELDFKTKGSKHYLIRFSSFEEAQRALREKNNRGIGGSSSQKRTYSQLLHMQQYQI
mmetsp:Transcript_33945/g.44788  ORF Transcript_33945/g.44788 Transcript_33945/m.44788 type:complete len:213 (-) Transcript_33945:93-731(-)